MSFFKNAGKKFGEGAGLVLGGSIKAAGKAMKSDFTQEIGEAIDKSMQNTGSLVGTVIDGIADVGVGVLENDENKRSKGLSHLGRTASTVGDQVLIATGEILGNTIDTADGLLERDWDKVKTSGRGLAKVAIVSTVAIGIVDILDGTELSGTDDMAATDSNQIENPNTHYVSPHERILPSGEVIWVDGDGDTSIDRSTGWVQTNPNYRA
uniref:hypothetical protein n=1 Tax=Psychrobacter sp. TaxID=56811 RepID=UPI0015987E73|nr:hypothetical protein [Psychrobacter sp.]QJS05800.1 hypothetical protein [Psychrobacter sp.]